MRRRESRPVVRTGVDGEKAGGRGSADRGEEGEEESEAEGCGR